MALWYSTAAQEPLTLLISALPCSKHLSRLVLLAKELCLCHGCVCTSDFGNGFIFYSTSSRNPYSNSLPPEVASEFPRYSPHWHQLSVCFLSQETAQVVVEVCKIRAGPVWLMRWAPHFPLQAKREQLLCGCWVKSSLFSSSVTEVTVQGSALGMSAVWPYLLNVRDGVDLGAYLPQCLILPGGKWGPGSFKKLKWEKLILVNWMCQLRVVKFFSIYIEKIRDGWMECVCVQGIHLKF